jgi:hypothetical protein
VIRLALHVRLASLRRSHLVCALLGCTGGAMWCRRCGGLVL